MPDWNALSLPDLYAEASRTGLIRRLLELARDEDLGPLGRDVSCAAVGAGRGEIEGVIVARSGGVVAGLACVPEAARLFGEDVAFSPVARDGDAVEPGARLGTLHGPGDRVLAAERTVLNLLGRLCGVATRTREFVNVMGPGHRARLYDTRKTTPGLRVLEKYAVRCGGGFCHRMGLYDAVLIKDNHLAGVPPGRLGAFVAEAATMARREAPAPAFVEVEVDSLDQLRALLSLPAGVVDIVLLDNMDAAMAREAVGLRDAARSRVELEISGGVTLQNIRGLAATGVERLSTGSVTHHAVWLDIALDILDIEA